MPKRRRPSMSNDKDFLAEDVPEVHSRLLEHVLTNGARLSKVRIAKLPYGIGIMASERIKKGEEITFIPKSLLLNVHDVPIPNSSPIDYPTRVHSSLAAYIASKRHSNDEDAFISILPSLTSFRNSMPMFWSDEILDNCSPWIKSFAKKQQEKLQGDYEHALLVHSENNLEFSREEYNWAWAAVNTRTIYYRPKKWYKVPTEDCMTMCPFIDYYNHDPEGDKSCLVGFSTEGLTVTTQKSYAAGEEIYVTYGDYNNDHLLVEYGFALPENRSDNINIDYWILSKLSPRHQTILTEMSFHGYDFTFLQNFVYSGSDLMAISCDGDASGYLLDANEVCYRTTMALRLAVIPEEKLPVANSRTGKGSARYRDFVRLVEGDMEEDDYADAYEADEKKARELLQEIIGEVEGFAQGMVANLRALLENGGSGIPKESIESMTGRWEQIIHMVATYKENSS